MLLILGLVMVVFGGGWRVLGIPARGLGVVLIVAGLISYYARRAER